MAVKTEWCVK